MQRLTNTTAATDVVTVVCAATTLWPKPGHYHYFLHYHHCEILSQSDDDAEKIVHVSIPGMTIVMHY